MKTKKYVKRKIAAIAAGVLTTWLFAAHPFPHPAPPAGPQVADKTGIQAWLNRTMQENNARQLADYNKATTKP